VPLQDTYGGPNYFALDEDALYEIHIDNNGDAVEDITSQFQFENEFMELAVPTVRTRTSRSRSSTSVRLTNQPTQT
jgi:Domain of unknown function (DUF4331)